MDGTNFNCINQGKISHWGRGSSSSDKQLETQQRSSKLKMHQPPSLFPYNYWLVPNPTSKLRGQNVSIQFLAFPVQLSDLFKSGVRSLHHQSHLLLANSQFSQTISWKNISSLLKSLHASPVYWFIKILLSFAESLSCRLSLISSSSHVSIAAPISPFIIGPHPASMGWILSVWFSGSM